MLSMTLGATLTPAVQAEADSLVATVMSLPIVGAALPQATIQSAVDQAISTVMDAAGAGAEAQLKPILIPAFIGLGALSLLGFFLGLGALTSAKRTREMVAGRKTAPASRTASKMAA